ncbi:MAG: hypothetical protein GPJ27_14660 [Microcystis aeruginosa L111-01]|uniref:Uncharacterized protein n=1 Tax=Microcystis aeruginosa G11-04 TaxID=2685956 RepID=A0A966FYS6_MICAE|nr:hypothetical protein [Microcystis aeruginosa W13-13]NCQ78895.1 hypothetical protein [Microcystis aeruginosa W13-15]NCR23076.1 hypothetical protein [Microcystis aeruginosa L111-01]NCR26739.1 hypothetical protein [Microcystis aeruginosa LE13-04]NCS39365.1 hypothetical protein [Microcystis aeruginosa BS13-10]NCS57224.1 hypothetical protein [Microcystis aeruginosa G11-04]NCT43170.1 hypothetical protein [Microcystis aeruginosa G11-09]
MTYSLTINNQSGAVQNVAVFQVNNPSTGIPLVWLGQTISNEGSYTFQWDITWQLGYGSTLYPLNTGVIYQNNFKASVTPNDANGHNELSITYVSQSFSATTGSPYCNAKLSSGVMRIITDTSFTVKQSLNMSVAVYMDQKPILASQGVPNSMYEFNTDTIYYLTVTDYPIGSVLPVDNRRSFVQEISEDVVIESGSVVSSPTQVVFNSGMTSWSYTLNDRLQFVQS